MDLHSHSKVSAHPDVVWRLVEGEVVLLNVTSGHYYSLDDVGSRIWSLLPAEGTTLAALQAQLEEEFDAPAEVIDRDLRALIERLASVQLVALA